MAATSAPSAATARIEARWLPVSIHSTFAGSTPASFIALSQREKAGERVGAVVGETPPGEEADLLRRLIRARVTIMLE